MPPPPDVSSVLNPKPQTLKPKAHKRADSFTKTLPKPLNPKPETRDRTDLQKPCEQGFKREQSGEAFRV